MGSDSATRRRREPYTIEPSDPRTLLKVARLGRVTLNILTDSTATLEPAGKVIRRLSLENQKKTGFYFVLEPQISRKSLETGGMSPATAGGPCCW